MGKAAAESAKWEQEKIKAVEVTKAQQAFEVAELQAKDCLLYTSSAIKDE